MRTGSERRGRGARRIVRGGGSKQRLLGVARWGGKGAVRKTSGARSPRLEALTEELRDVAERVGIRVRQERLLREVGYHAQSGLVRLDGTEILLLDQDLSPEVRVDLLVGILAGRDLSGIELSDEARRALAIADVPEPRAPTRSKSAPDDTAGASPGDGRPSSGAS